MPRVRAWAFGGVGLALLQIALGIANVLWRLPVPLREAHAANAAVTFIVFVIATFLATLDPLVARSELQRTPYVAEGMRRA
jgi:heme A synthase